MRTIIDIVILKAVLFALLHDVFRLMRIHDVVTFFFNFPVYLQSVEIHSDIFNKWCVWKRGRVEECSVASLRNKRVKTLRGCRGEKGYKLRLTTKAKTNKQTNSMV
jgi:hypothetical protein